MKEQLTAMAKSNLKKIRGFQIVATIFGSISVILFFIGLTFHPGARFWVNFPTLVFLMVMAIMYVSMFGFKTMRESALERDDEDLEREIARLYVDSTEGLELREDIDMEDRLELLELERIKERVKIRQERD
ncbi:2TM domain-containing protein [Saprospiraceae bacterium]|nr:2TM domain-containing protein [Saprospiraceae bacterium]